MSPSDRVKAAVAGALPTAYGGVAHWHRPRARRGSWLLRAETGGHAPATLLVEIPKRANGRGAGGVRAAGPDDASEAEFRALEAIADAVAASGDPGLAAVVPVAYVSEVGAIVTEQLRARPLKDLLGWRDDDPTEYFRRAGRWLSLFHGIGGRSPRPFQAHETIDEAIATDGSLADLASTVIDAVRTLAYRPSLEVVIHGDFTTANILVTIDDRVAVVGPERRPGRPTEDVADLLTELRFADGGTFGVARRRSTVESWAQGVLDGYPGLDPAVLVCDRAIAILRLWSAREERLRGPARLVLKPFRRRVASEVRALLDAL